MPSGGLSEALWSTAPGGGNTSAVRLQELGVAERLRDFDLSSLDPPRAPVPYPLEQWFDGGHWRIWSGEDFDGDVVLMRSRLHYHAAARGLRIRSRRVMDGERRGLVFVARPREVDG